MPLQTIPSGIIGNDIPCQRHRAAVIIQACPAIFYYRAVTQVEAVVGTVVKAAAAVAGVIAAECTASVLAPVPTV